MLWDLPDSLYAAFWGALLSLLGYATLVKSWAGTRARRAWPSIRIKAERQRVGDIEMTDIAILYSGWGLHGNADHAQPPKVECSIYVMMKKNRKK